MSIKMKMSPLPVASSSDSRISSFGDRELVALLTKYFGYSTFRGKQLEAINAVLSGRDCFCLMPTGAGKSLCFQIPALAKSGIVLVICPLIALMENQVAALKEKKIPAEYIASTQPAQIKGKIYDDLESGRPIIRLLYVTPELVSTTRFMSKLTKLNSRGLLTLIAIDEAHCISTWGHDFRPSYRKLSHLREQLMGVPLLALTATAVPKVQNDVITLLSLYDPLILRASFNRPNIFYEVRYKDVLNDTFADLLKLLQSYKGACCIVYCLERSTCDELAAHLSRGGISCAAYHAGLNNKLRSSVLDDWISSKIHVVVATVAFGMGIDRKDVRVVCHFNVPKSMEAFYQESGRAGRDQQPSRSVLYYGLEDRRKMEFILNNAIRKKSQSPNDHDGLSKKALETFNQMVEYCEGDGCRRKKILESFEEQVSASFCGKTCDACKHPVLVTENLGKLVQAPSFCKSNGLCPIFINSSINVESRDEEDDLCDDDNQTNLSEDISDSDDGLEVIRSLHKSRMTSKSGIMEKLECLQRAEESYYQKDPKKKPCNSDNNKKAVTEAQRQACKVKLLDALKQTEQRLGDLRVNLEASAAALEGECFVKFGKAGKSFYISQVASSVRWLMSTNYADFCKRLGIVSTEETHLAGFEVAVSSSEKLDDLQPVEKPTHGSTKETAQVGTSLQPVFVHSEISYEQKVLPHIMSFSEYVSKGNESESNCSPSSKKHLSANVIRKNGDKEEKKMRLC